MTQHISVEHHIQRDILKRLTRGGLRFSQLKPDGMESNIFMYHIGVLRKLGLIEKLDAIYQLTLPGMSYVDQLSSQTFTPRLQPKAIAVLVADNSRGEIAVLRRHTEPYEGSLMLPSGKLHYGEQLTAHARRELAEKTGLVADPTYAGVASIAIGNGESLVTHVLATVWRATVGDEAVHCSDPRFEALWTKKEAIQNDSMPGTAELLDISMGETPFMVDLHMAVPETVRNRFDGQQDR